MTIRQIRMSAQAKDQLIRLKRFTGIPTWNVLCRWAFCVSLAEPATPTPVDIPADSNVEMSWAVFGGDQHDVYFALLIERCVSEGIELTREDLHKQLRLHIHSGLGYLSSPNRIRSIADLVALARDAA